MPYGRQSVAGLDPDNPAAMAAGGHIVDEETQQKNEITGGNGGLADDTKKLLLRFMNNAMTVDKDAISAQILEKQMERDSFCRLPFTIIFFAVYSLAILNHESVTNSGMVQREMRGMLEGTTFEGVAHTSGHKDMGDIDTKEDVYMYLREALIPLFINPLPPATAREDLHRALRYNMIIGGVVIQQVRRKNIKCNQEYPDLGPFKDGGKVNPLLANFSCFPWTSEDMSCFGPKEKQRVNDQARAGWCPDSIVFSDAAASDESVRRRLDYVDDGGGSGGGSKGASDIRRETLFSVNLYEYEGLGKAIEKVNEMEAEGWIDYQTSWVGVQFLVLNPDLNIFVAMTMNIYMSPSGAMLSKVDAQSFMPEPYQFKSVLALDGLFVLCVLWLTLGVMKEMVNHVRTEKCHHYVSNAWHILDVLSVLMSFVVFLLWMILLDQLTTIKTKAMAVVAAEPQPGAVFVDTYPQVVAELHDSLREISSYLSMWRMILCWYTILIAMKFLESFANQPRLAVVTKTITRAGSDLFHFGIVMGTVFVSYSVAGMFLFGRRMHDFSSEPTSFSTCFLIMLGDFDWETLGWEHPLTAGLWFWTYMVVMNMLMLNMLMAIIMDVYTEVKSEADEFAPVWTQLYTTLSDIVNTYRGHMVSNAEMLQVLQDMPEDDVDETVLMRRAGPGLSKDQASLLIENTKKDMDSKLNAGVTMSDAMRMIGWVKISVQNIHYKLQEILEAEAEEEALITGKSIEELAIIKENKDKAIAEDRTAYVADAAQRITDVQSRMTKIENFMQESLQYSTYRGKDLRNRLAVIEDLIRNQRDIVARDSADIWDQMPPKLGSI